MKKRSSKKLKGKNKSLVICRGWVAIGTLAAYAATGAARPAVATERSLPRTDGAASAALPLKRFDIPAGPLEQAISSFEKATGLKVEIVTAGGDTGRDSIRRV